MRVLLSDGSGLTARQVATQLHAAGHVVEVLSPDALALTRFTKHVRRVHRVPPYGADPLTWLDAALAIYSRGGYDALLPTQEQVAVLSACRPRLDAAGVAAAVPAFDALAAVQDKVAAHRTLAAAGLTQPATSVVASAAELVASTLDSAFVKIPIGTATSGVTRVDTAADLAVLASALDADGAFRDVGVVVQAAVTGPLAMVQCVFADGELVASHANVRVREGARGGASHKRSIDVPAVREDMARLGAHLAWHGALSVDAILTDDGPSYIDVNPRLVEPGNAWRAGVDLVGPLLDLACGRPVRPQPPGRADVATHQLLLAVLGAAQHVGTRRSVVRELADAARRRDSYHASVEELTPLRGDLRSAIPVVVAATAAVVRPNTWRWFSSGAVTNYALTPAGWRAIRERADRTA